MIGLKSHVTLFMLDSAVHPDRIVDDDGDCLADGTSSRMWMVLCNYAFSLEDNGLVQYSTC